MNKFCIYIIYKIYRADSLVPGFVELGIKVQPSYGCRKINAGFHSVIVLYIYYYIDFRKIGLNIAQSVDFVAHIS